MRCLGANHSVWPFTKWNYSPVVCHTLYTPLHCAIYGMMVSWVLQSLWLPLCHRWYDSILTCDCHSLALHNKWCDSILRFNGLQIALAMWWSELTFPALATKTHSWPLTFRKHTPFSTEPLMDTSPHQRYIISTSPLQWTIMCPHQWYITCGSPHHQNIMCSRAHLYH